MRSVPLGDTSMHRRHPSASSSLPAISEDGSFIESCDAPPIPPRATHRPTNQNLALSSPPIFNYDRSPPEYNSHFKEGPLDGEGGEKLSGLKWGLANNKHIAKRGGWKRLGIIAAIVLFCIVGLIVGVIVGVESRHSSSKSVSTGENGVQSGSGNGTGTGSGNGTGSNSSNGGPTTTEGPSNSTSNSANSTFPVGSYSINTYLSTVAANCTSNPATWLCWPYSTYAESQSSSNATFDWIITPVHDQPNNYTISSTPNIFSLVFTNLPLILKNAGTAEESYYFQTSMSKQTKPTTQLGKQNVAATCYFNSTTFQGYLYTQQPKTYPVGSANAIDMVTDGTFGEWPFAARIEQIAGGGEGTPTCVDPSGNSLGDFSEQDDSQLCDCLYLNYGT
ncbi:hypothetical protein G7Y89_g6139 [Cudoniella acicularis]|uniref:Tat pathway signal sequence n=1 Tax=Cudoniella acicularis TaxID=354080 RepID=A0A8H4RNA7_9HELO|nr:hypothetical protein G7Y89_g6139 [Cudoniella acicularis]